MMKRVFSLPLALTLWGGAAQAQVVVDAVSASYVGGTSGTTLTLPLTVGSGTNRALAAMLFFETTAVPTISAATWNTSQNLSVVAGTTTTNGGNSASSIIYCLAAPASGAHNAVFTFTTAVSYGILISFTGVDQTTPCQNGNSAVAAVAAASPATVTITSATGDIAIATEGQGCSAWGTISGTTAGTNLSGPQIGVAANYANGAATVAMSAAFTGTCTWNISGADIKAAAGGGATAKPRLMPLTGAGR